MVAHAPVGDPWKRHTLRDDQPLHGGLTACVTPPPTRLATASHRPTKPTLRGLCHSVGRLHTPTGRFKASRLAPLPPPRTCRHITSAACPSLCSC